MRNFARLLAVCSIFGIVSPLCAQPPTNSKLAVPALSVAEMEKLWGKPTRISVNFQDVSYSQAIAEIERQSGVRINKGNIKSPVTFRADDLPFWAAMQGLLQPANLRVIESIGLRDLDPLSADLEIVPSVGKAIISSQEITPVVPQIIHPYVALAWKGSSRANYQNLNYGGFLSTTQSNSSPTVSLDAGALLDPRLNQIPAQVAVRLDSIVDAQGRAVLIQNVHSHSHPQGGQRLVRGLSINFSGQDIVPGPTKLQSVRGALTFHLETRHEIWEVLNLMQAKEVTKTFKTSEGDFSLTLVGVMGKEGRYQINLRGRGNADAVRERGQFGGGIFASAFHDLLSRVQVFDAKGVEYPGNGGSTSSSGDSVDVTINVSSLPGARDAQPKLGEPDKLVVEIPSEIRQLEIPFEIKDLPLP